MLQLKDLRQLSVGRAVDLSAPRGQSLQRTHAPFRKRARTDLQLLKGLGGPRDGRAPVRKPGCKRRTWFAGHGGIVPT